MPNKLRNYAFVLGGAALLLSAGVAFAQDGRGDGERRNLRPENRQQTERQDERRSATSTNMMQRGREDEDRNDRQNRGRGEDMREKAEKHMEQIQDRRKQDMAKNLSRQFVQINQSWTRHFSQLLDRYTTILRKVKDRAAAAQAAGRDVSAVNIAVTSAQTAIATARTAVAAQAAKTYVIDLSVASSTVTTATSTAEGQGQMIEGIKKAFNDLHKQLFDALFTLRDGPMTDARKAVQNAIQTLGQVRGVDEVHATSTVSTATSTDR